ncbi:S41 family peptidase [bacterium]|nr:S41 family peptidase [bacterium]
MKKPFYGIAGILALILLTSFPIQAFCEEEYEELDIFQLETLILDRVRRAYVDSISGTELLQGAVDGMIKKLDPHSSYMPRSTADDFSEKIRGDFEGVGITFAILDNKITVIEVVEGGPSEMAGLLSRDKIVKIDNKSVLGIKEDKVKDLLRGPSGSTVTVHVERPGEDKLLKFTITRDKVNINSVTHAYMIDDKTGYISLTRFTIKTQDDVAKALDKLKAMGMQRLVLDLRNNSGGSLEAAVSVVNFFINRGTVVYTKGRRDSDNNTWNASPSEKYTSYTTIPLIVMINHYSASASEIVAGALQDHDRALIVGQTSFGKGLVMNPFPLVTRLNKKNFGTLMLSVAHYYTPSGRLIQRPYDNGRDDYIKEGFDDVDPNAADSSKVGKPVYYTDLGRNVYGGGGITPDRVIEIPPKLNEYESALRGTHIFFEFANDYLIRHNDIPVYFEDFLLQYRIPENEFERFKKYAIDRNITSGDTIPFNTDLEKFLQKYEIPEDMIDGMIKNIKESGHSVSLTLFEESRHFIEREIKQEIARIKWGSEARYRIWHTDDTELINTLTFFDEASELLAKRLAIGNL